MMSRHATDNPDLHLSVEVDPERLEQLLQLICQEGQVSVVELSENEDGLLGLQNTCE